MAVTIGLWFAGVVGVAIVLILACIYVVLTLLADMLNAVLDPRIRVR